MPLLLRCVRGDGGGSVSNAKAGGCTLGGMERGLLQSVRNSRWEMGWAVTDGECDRDSVRSGSRW